MDDEQDPQDPMAAALAKLRAGQRSTPPDMDAALSALRGSGPITPGHSKFSADELKTRADQSVDDATQETIDEQGSLIRTLQAPFRLALEGTVGGNIAAEIPQAARVLGAVKRGGSNALRSVGQNIGTVRDVALSPVSGAARGRLAMRVVKGFRDAVGEAGAVPKPFATPAPVADAVEGVVPGSGSLARAKSAFAPAEEEFVKGYPISGDPPNNPALMRQLEEGLLRMKPKATTPLSRIRGEPAPPFRPTGGRTSPPSVADVLRARRHP